MPKKINSHRARAKHGSRYTTYHNHSIMGTSVGISSKGSIFEGLSSTNLLMAVIENDPLFGTIRKIYKRNSLVKLGVESKLIERDLSQARDLSWVKGPQGSIKISKTLGVKSVRILTSLSYILDCFHTSVEFPGESPTFLAQGVVKEILWKFRGYPCMKEIAECLPSTGLKYISHFDSGFSTLGTIETGLSTLHNVSPILFWYLLSELRK